MKALRIVPDPSRCSGCMICVITCSFTHFNKVSPALSAIRIEKFEEEWMKGLVDCVVSQSVCKQCPDKDPPCAAACLTGALRRDPEKGCIILDHDLCITCRACVISCPFEGIHYSEETGRVVKCDLCGGDPACVKRCPEGALKLEEVF